MRSNRVGAGAGDHQADSRSIQSSRPSISAVSGKSALSAASRIRTNDTFSGKAIALLKLLLIILPPLVVMTVFAAVNMVEADYSRQVALLLQHNLEEAIGVRGLVHRLQIERAATCLVISSTR